MFIPDEWEPDWDEAAGKENRRLSPNARSRSKCVLSMGTESQRKDSMSLSSVPDKLDGGRAEDSPALRQSKVPPYLVVQGSAQESAKADTRSRLRASSGFTEDGLPASL